MTELLVDKNEPKECHYEGCLLLHSGGCDYQNNGVYSICKGAAWSRNSSMSSKEFNLEVFTRIEDSETEKKIRETFKSA